MVFQNYLVGAVVALSLFELVVGLKGSAYTKPSLEVGKRLKGYVPNVSPGYAHEYGFGHYYQGDILLRKDQKLGKLALGEQYVLQMWADAIVPYVIDGNFTASELALLDAAFAQFAELTCVRFVARVDELFYVSIRNDDVGCYSYIGRNPSNQNNRINLQTPECMTNIGTPVHEMMHALGFFHEFSRPDRDSYVTITTGNLRPEYQNPEFIQTNFGMESAADTTSYGVPYNYGSVMHYSRYAGAVGLCCPVIDNLTPYFGDFGSDTGLTDGDVEQVMARYCQNENE